MTWGGFFNYLPMFCICKLRSTAMIKYKKSNNLDVGWLKQRYTTNSNPKSDKACV